MLIIPTFTRVNEHSTYFYDCNDQKTKSKLNQKKKKKKMLLHHPAPLRLSVTGVRHKIFSWPLPSGLFFFVYTTNMYVFMF